MFYRGSMNPAIMIVALRELSGRVDEIHYLVRIQQLQHMRPAVGRLSIRLARDQKMIDASPT
jgi:hypothetical protein